MEDRNLTRREFAARGAALALIGLVPGALAACGGGSSGDGGAGDSLDMIVGELPLQLTGTRQLIQGAGALLIALEPLVVADPRGRIEPSLARRFETPDPRTFVFDVRPGVRFWDGEPLTAADVAYSLELHRTDVGSILNRWWALAERVETDGSDRVVVTLERPYAGFVYAVAQTPIVQRAYNERHKQAIGTPKALNMGTGAWKFERFDPDKSIELVANDDYWGEKPRYRRITTRMVADPSTAALSIKTGEVTGNLAVPVTDTSHYEKLGGVRVEQRPSTAVCVITLNTLYAPWDDVNVRRAMQHAVNRQACVEGALGGHGQPELSIVSEAALREVMPAEDASALLAEIEPLVEFDLDKARAALAESAHPDGFEVGTVIDGETEIVRTLELIKQDLAEIGITLKITQAPSSVYEEQYGSSRYSLGSYTVTPDSGDPLTNLVGGAFDKAGVTETGGNGPNATNFTSPELQRLLEQLRATPLSDRARRAELCAEMVRYNAREALYVGVWSPRAVLAINDAYRYPAFNELWWQTRWPDQIERS
ncbi:ABC transporter substrate-binding protein [Conexibacter woesei]|uniref:Extracellular solute-binding protein family 5 n=1 Tax=Conexibacter woesei (strain DSM 14684 / CCUG 47730 / CIP 108061 / JCM 11494 / NBRC 100937 / ID131577) TaxID=469383 RepID=D3F4G7_CONWI|nr:ABC transporter substrate-binding protein [Conexibacter woesei]ADB50539.1 extracellular solute-binding protein family 5 [Conexibacter woesei DSM 14684]